MSTTVLIIIAGVLLFAYFIRRRSRLSRDDD